MSKHATHDDLVTLAKSCGEGNYDGVADLVVHGKMPMHKLEDVYASLTKEIPTVDGSTELNSYEQAVHVRRSAIEKQTGSNLTKLPYTNYEYSKVHGCNCEMVIGYVPIPVGVAGPLNINGEDLFVPMATTEGALVASTNRGCKAITRSGGAKGRVFRDGITRSPCVRLPTAMEALDLFAWVEEPENFSKLEKAVQETSRYARLKTIKPLIAGRHVHLRICCSTGDAMGMNMISKATLAILSAISAVFESMVVVSISGNTCTDKKAAAMNMIEGRGKSLVVEANLKKDVVASVLKTTAEKMIEVNVQKNLVGSALAGCIGGNNAHASNIVTALFLATGQDPAQNVEGSSCFTLLEKGEEEGDLWVSVTMPSVEVGTVGGGTHLSGQKANLELLGLCKENEEKRGACPKKLAVAIGGAVLAGELSLIAALSTNDLVKSHMVHNRR